MEISKVGVVGCGLMGHGIAQICAQAGWEINQSTGDLVWIVAKIQRAASGRDATFDHWILNRTIEQQRNRGDQITQVVPHD